ncbi:hypothetical protein M3694_11035 [Kocuria marina]|uniref:hypothetical protein n=1 Tax=Kocuria marina TaxID=223184 RepID=UPI002989B38D|nr:hypothetical protein [Kocuria marina]MCT2362248.1 hypothetical protein [Kocuria marina]
MPLINVGSAYRSITGPPMRFALRIYVPQQDLDAAYAPGIPRALDPFTAGVHELSEQLARLSDISQPLLPPAREPLWTMPFSTAPAGSRRLPGPTGDFPVFHPTQRLRRSLRLFTAAENDDSAQLLPLLVPEKQVSDAAKATSRETFDPVYTRESAYVVPLAWFAAFAPEDHVTSYHSGHEVHRLIAPADTAARRVIQAAQTVEDAAQQASGGADEHDLPDEARQAAAFAQDLTRLGRWLGAFSAASVVSLDYGSIADRLQPDESPRDMADAVELLREGDLAAATAALRRIFMRWAPLAHLQQAN